VLEGATVATFLRSVLGALVWRGRGSVVSLGAHGCLLIAVCSSAAIGSWVVVSSSWLRVVSHGRMDMRSSVINRSHSLFTTIRGSNGVLGVGGSVVCLVRCLRISSGSNTGVIGSIERVRLSVRTECRIEQCMDSCEVKT
jgi:hypothetical protein